MIPYNLSNSSLAASNFLTLRPVMTRFAPSLASIWTQDLRNSLVVSVQALILDKDVDTFLDEFQSLVEEYYTPAESES